MAEREKQDIFTKFTTKTSEILGRPWAFILALIAIVVWAASGLVFGFSDTWQLVINTATTIVTFLMVFVIQNTQNRSDLAVNIKLDRLLEDNGHKGEEVLAAESHSDKRLEREQKREQRKAKYTRRQKK